jgi:hypothetical protein
LLWLGATLADGVVNSLSVVVDVDKLLDDDGNFGAEKVLDTAESTDSWESGKPGLCTVMMVGIWVVLSLSDGAIE